MWFFFHNLIKKVQYYDLLVLYVFKVVFLFIIFSVFYKDTPINLRTLHTLVSYPGPKYKKVSFSNPGHAFNLAERLNNIFSCDDFKVCQMVKGPEVSEDELKKWTTVTI